jgi:hypothetical protein
MQKGNFSGKVVEIFNDSYNPYIHIVCDSLSDLSDVFVQFISTEQITTDEQGNAKHRLAGWKPKAPKKAWEGGGTPTSLIDLDTTLKRSFSPKDGFRHRQVADDKL